MSGAGGDRREKPTLEEQEVKAFTLESPGWPAGAASGAGQGSTRSAGLGSWGCLAGASVWPRTLNLQLARQLRSQEQEHHAAQPGSNAIVARCDFKLSLSWERKTLTKKSLHIYF